MTRIDGVGKRTYGRINKGRRCIGYLYLPVAFLDPTWMKLRYLA